MSFDNCEHCNRSFPQDTGTAFYGDKFQYKICCEHCAQVVLPKTEAYGMSRNAKQGEQKCSPDEINIPEQLI